MAQTQANERSARYHRQVGEALTRTYARAARRERRVELAEARYVIFSDQHKGVRDGADDFRHCEKAYNAALGYYLEAGHHLIVLGDAEELWEAQPTDVFRSYAHTLRLEAEFHREGRYTRVWGNHDDLWASDLAVRSLLGPIFPGIRVPEAIRLRITDGGRTLGRIFLVHGHQGERWSDRWSRLARLPVRYVWPAVQRFTGGSLNTPARDFRLRKRRDVAMYAWAEEVRGVVLVAGHTHAPIFRSKPRASRIEEELEAARAAPGDAAAAERVRLLRAELEWVRAQENQAFGEQVAPMAGPCYFNAGCCCFVDGHITGIEISEREIRLVRWPDEEHRPVPTVLERAELQEVFAAC
ncbi:MAG TPA: hypothetical protein VHG28_19255 [Longimicrobiaceae bacterium]|nr:hypothetical protein [Longimicrobiaceae bacterium]